MGVRAIGDCLRLPRDGFARRFGPELLRSLDRALGRVPDPRVAFAPQERFVARRDLEPEIADTERLGRAIVPLLDELCRCLQARARGVAAIELRLVHRDAPATRVLLRFAEPVSRAERMAGLLRERLARTELPAPVHAVRVRSGPPMQVSGQDGDLFARDRRGATGVPQLVERLRARLGADAVQGLHLVPEHRPECAWENRDILQKWGKWGLTPFLPGNRESPHFRRPLWLLAQPQAIEGDECPRHEGQLEIEEGPERIESGWWDGRDVQRDYYVARGLTGVRLWVFRDRRRRGDDAGGWFLHGVFG
jgi:protein ImuB